MSTNHPLIIIVVLNWNGCADTIECLESVRALDYPNFRTVLVDNGSTDRTVVATRQHFPDVHIIQNGRNLGYAAGNNVGIRYALRQGADYILILNNDTIF